MTRILITTFGTRGDIQPFIALGKGLRQAGYEVAVCTSEGFKAFVEEHGLHYLFMDNDLLRLTREALSGVGGIREAMNLTKHMSAAIRRSMDDEWRAAQTFQPDLIIYHPKCLGSYHVAEKLGVPAIMSLPLPFYTPTSAYPVPFFPDKHLGGSFNRFSYRLMGLSNSMYTGTVNDFRLTALDFAPIGRFHDLLTRSDGSPVPVLYPYSAHVLPVPADYPAHVHVTGYWFLDSAAAWQPPAELSRFLHDGSTPVYVGFGSVGASSGEKRTRIVLEALQKAGKRALLASGWGGLKPADLPQNVLMMESVPHDWLFPQVSAVVHHGGAGTTAAGLRAGKPTIICPFLGDQPFWGRLVHQLGVGPNPIGQRHLTAANLSQAIVSTVEDEAIQQRAAELGAKIRGEDGIAQAVAVIGTIVKQPVAS